MNLIDSLVKIMLSVFKTRSPMLFNPFRFQLRKKSYVSLVSQFLLKDQLLLFNTITSGAFLGLGDIIQQEFEFRRHNKPRTIDWLRVGRMFVVGFFVGPLHHYYYINLDKLLPRADMITAFKKVIADQTVASPLTLGYFFYSMGILEGKSIKEIHEEMRNKFMYLYMGDCLFWPPIQIVNFRYVPSEYRVFYINLATLVFDIFLSYIKHDFEYRPIKQQ